MRSTALAVVLWLGGLSTAFSTQLVENGGFETGNLGDWDASPNVVVVDDYFGIDPNSGDYMAAMPFAGVLDAFLFQPISIDTSQYSELHISFAYNLIALDVTRFVDLGIDRFVANLGPLQLLNESLNDAFGGGATSTGWNTFNASFSNIPNLGVITLDFGFIVENIPPGGGDIGQSFVALVDDVSIEAGPDAVPVPPSLALMGLGFAGLGLRRIRRRAA